MVWLFAMLVGCNPAGANENGDASSLEWNVITGECRAEITPGGDPLIIQAWQCTADDVCSEVGWEYDGQTIQLDGCDAFISTETHILLK